MVVESASAMQLAGNNFYKLEDCNHIQVCKPPNQSHPSYSMLLNVLRHCTKGLDTPKLPRELMEQAKMQEMIHQRDFFNVLFKKLDPNHQN
jgi:hypothetical protein